MDLWLIQTKWKLLRYIVTSVLPRTTNERKKMFSGKEFEHAYNQNNKRT